MVMQKRLDYGFNGYQAPVTPRATRSARRRSSFWKKCQDNQHCAFDLLATVAGKLLLEGESGLSGGNTSKGIEQCNAQKDTADEEQRDVEIPLKIEPDQESCKKSFLSSELVNQPFNRNNNLQESVCSQHKAFPAPVISTSDYAEGAVCAGKFVIDDSKIDVGRKEGAGLYGYSESNCLKLEFEPNRHVKVESLSSGKALVSSRVDQCCVEDPALPNGKSHALVSSDSSAEIPLYREPIPRGSFPACREDVKLVSRDDDENSSECTQHSTRTKAFRQPPRIIDRRVRKLLASKYWKLHSTSTSTLRDGDLSNIDAEMKRPCCYRKTSYKRQRSQRIYPFKKRKFCECTSASNYEVGINSDRMFSSSKKSTDEDSSGSHGAMLGGMPPAFGGQHTSCQSRDSLVKLRIKSFKVPELLIDIPETATVGSLKKTVMEAVTAILGGGLHIGVLLRGKKVRDDNRTLLQTGLCHDNKLDSLGFTLEPNPAQAPTSLGHEGHLFAIPYDVPQPLTRYAGTATAACKGASSVPPDPPVPSLGNAIESDYDSAPSTTDMLIDKNAVDSRALVAIPATTAEALAVFPLHRKSKQAELVQRRIRRPFSVSEVEALVQAVEKLGTGRWRDVKLRSFDNAKHRTYVDLKDKWKTLVHTARISPQQRRGEPVPQELLDRVLKAHAYWSEQQTKQQLKHQQQQQQQRQPPETCLLL